jgi:nitroreductase
MTNNVLEGFTKRRSIRAFTGAAVDREMLTLALKAAMSAPSSHNGRPWSFIVVTDRDRIRALCAAHPHATFGKDAGAVVVPFGRKQDTYFDQDMAAATENFLLAIAGLGLGATWCGMNAAYEGTVGPLLKLPAEYTAFALIPVGVPAETKEPRTQFEERRIHWEQYGG